MFKKSLFAVFAMFASCSAFAAVPYEGTVAAPKIYGGSGDQATGVSAVFNCNDGIFGKADVCVDADTVIYDKVVRMTMAAKLSPMLSLHARTIVMRYTFRASYADGAVPQHMVVLKRPDNGLWQVPVNPGQPMLVTCLSRDGGASWPDCRKIAS